MKLIQDRFLPMISSSEDSLVSRLVTLVATSVLTIPGEHSFLPSHEFSGPKDRSTFFLKMLRVYFLTTLEKLSSRSSIRWTKWGMMRNGECLTRSTLASPKIGRESILQDILETNVSWRKPRRAELNNSKSRGNGGPHRPIKGVKDIQKALTVQDSYRLLVGKKVKGVLKVRTHTITECERLQGFPDGWTRCASLKNRFKLLGNAVTPNVISFVVTRIFVRREMMNQTMKLTLSNSSILEKEASDPF